MCKQMTENIETFLIHQMWCMLVVYDYSQYRFVHLNYLVSMIHELTSNMKNKPRNLALTAQQV